MGEMFVCLLLVSGLATAVGQNVPCLTTRAECTGNTGFSSMAVFNNNFFCCAAGYSMSWFNNQCSCTKTSEVTPCDKGPVACRNAGSFTSDGQGNTYCCPQGSSMQSFSGFVNGMQIGGCTCTRYLGSNGGGIQIINGGINVDPNFNATVFAERMHEWSQRFSARMQNMANNLRRSLSNMFRNMWI